MLESEAWRKQSLRGTETEHIDEAGGHRSLKSLKDIFIFFWGGCRDQPLGTAQGLVVEEGPTPGAAVRALVARRAPPSSASPWVRSGGVCPSTPPWVLLFLLLLLLLLLFGRVRGKILKAFLGLFGLWALGLVFFSRRPPLEVQGN